MGRVGALAFVLGLGPVVSSAAATALPVIGTAVYSDACVSDGGRGDFAGYRVTITRQSNALRIVVEFNDSGPDGKTTARDVKFDPSNGRLSFSFQGDLPHTFAGIVSVNRLDGKFDGEAVSLAAIKQAPQFLAACKPSHRF